ncbi:MAG: lipopolysaccharide heptosyltransferase II [Candidatus Omnitrophota bacterium]
MRILLTRTDRIGDVVLSTPAIKAVRDKYPDAYIAFMVRPYARDVVEGNPYIDEVIIYDKYGEHKNLLNTVLFAISLRKKRFDLAIMLHPTNRAHMIAFAAGISRRVGYDKKLSFLLTERVPHLKQEGKKHESEYTLDLLETIGIRAKGRELFLPLNDRDIKNIENTLSEYHLGREALLIAVNPGASCPSKRWRPESFAKVCDGLAEKYKARIIIAADASNSRFADILAGKMRYEPVNLAGKTTVGELAALLSKCDLFISNDSGPVHIACAIGTPTISIFGRGDPGLSSERWGPIGKETRVFHKDVGCDPCLAHNCKIGFKCLEAITPEEVLSAAEELLFPAV